MGNSFSVGNQKMNCPQLHAHKSNILKVKQDKYLGDVISFDGKNDHNIKKKVSASLGAISNIINIMREICLGKFYFKTAFLLRQTIFLSTVLLNAETWINLSKNNIEELEKIDRILIKRILEAPASTSTKSLYLESGCIPIRFLIKARRIMFLHYLLNRDKSELISNRISK